MHTIHNSFKAGHKAAGWTVEEFLSSLYWLFHDSPARREDFIEMTSPEKMPLRFCGHRWLENKSVARRALQVWPDVKKFVQAPENFSKFKHLKSFKTLVELAIDPFLEAQVEAFISVATVLELFLEKFQKEEPMALFLAADLFKVVKQLLVRFMTEAKLAEISISSINDLDLEDEGNHVGYSKIDPGFIPRKILSQLKESKKVS